MGTVWDWMALRLREKAAEDEWRESITRHTSQDIASRLYAWRHLERKRAELHAWMARYGGRSNVGQA